MTVRPLLDLDRLEDELPARADAYRTAAPFPHVIVDDLLTSDVVERLVAEHDAVAHSTWRNYIHLNERKFANSDPTTWGPTLVQIAEELATPRFVGLLEQLTGIEGLRPDPQMDGGGLHRSLRGGFLNVHADFTAHHGDPHLRRRVNLLLFLNPDWDESWGGALEFWSADMQRAVTSIVPTGGRVVVFTTTETSYHGHPDPLRCPSEVARRSLALYYFTPEQDLQVRATDYRARPDDGLRRVAISLDNQALHLYDRIKRRLGLSDGAISRLGGVLARRRRDRP